jgi:DNA-binding MarR family transcriptional regulator
MTDEGVIRALEQVVVRSGTITTRALAEVHPEVHALTISQYRAFALVASAPDGLRVVELARRSSSLPQTATKIVQRLEAKGLVRYERGALAEDRRAVVVRLTDAGTRTWTEISARRRELLQAAVEGADLPTDAGRVLEALAAAFERFTA